MLAHRAEEDGVACVDGMTGRWAHVDYGLVPAVVFTHPEIAAVGRTEEQLVADGVAFKKGVFPFRANGRARTINDTAGKVKVLADAATDRVLGVHIIGPAAGDLIGEAAAAMNFGATAEDIARVCHAHPTLPEALKEAALAVDGRAIHA
jgi:dihydrolipoamide dehydrogenase